MNSKKANTYVVIMLPAPTDMMCWHKYVTLGFDGFGIVAGLTDATIFDDDNPDETIRIVEEWSSTYHKATRKFSIKYINCISATLDELSEM